MRAPRRRRLTAVAVGLAVAGGLGLSGATADRSSAAPTTASAPDLTTAAPEVGTATAGTAAAEPEGPPQSDFLSAFFYSAAHPAAVPAGANDWACKPDQAHPRPVVLVHGTFENRYDNWAALAPKLKDAGYCVYALNHGGDEGQPVLGTGDIPASAGQLAAFVDKVRAATGADRVDLVGHSQGGLLPRYYLGRLGGAAKVDKLVALVPSNHGTSLAGLALLARAIPGAEDALGAGCPACRQQLTGSDFLKELNAGGETQPGVTYTVITTRYDEVVTPYTSAFLEPGPNVTKATLQDVCPANATEHIGISYDRAATRLVLNALDPAHAQRPVC
ncbi:esterase/lipase family protein [Streptomyces sp. NPDC053542]|uniref:esterase/lipase family protein n=1 Tax=Streptomyces sp. NPDC053542 TaxID=3365710 RepID=UPI0037D8A04D